MPKANKARQKEVQEMIAKKSKANATSFKKGNAFWQARTSVGREKLFKDPEALWTAACEYFKWCDDNPHIHEDVYGGAAVRRKTKKLRAYTWNGLEIFLGVHSLKHYKSDTAHAEFSNVISAIDNIIYEQKFSAAAAGLLHANIISRDLGLADKMQAEQKADVNTTIKVVYEEAKPIQHDMD